MEIKLERAQVKAIERKEPSRLRKIWLFLTFRRWVDISKIRVKQGHLDGLMSVDIDEAE